MRLLAEPGGGTRRRRPPAHRSSAGPRSSRWSSRPSARGRPRAGRSWSRSSARPAWARAASCASWPPRLEALEPRADRARRAAACPTARAPSTGRWARCCARSAGSTTRTAPRPPARSSRRGCAQLLGGDADEQTVALLGSLLGMEDTLDLDPQRRREAFLAAARALIEGNGRAAPAGARIRGHPLGRQRHARPRRAHRAVGARTRAHRRAWPATSCSSAARVGLGPAHHQRHAAPAHGRRRPPTWSARCSAAAWTPQTIAERSGGNPFFAEEMVRRLTRASGVFGRRPPRDGPRGCSPRAWTRCPRSSARLLQQAAVIGRTFWATRSSATGGGRGRRPAGGARRAGRARADRARARGGGSPASPSWRSSTCSSATSPTGCCPRAVAGPQALRGRLRSSSAHAGDRADEVAPLLAEHYGRAAALGAEAQLDEDELAHDARRRAALRRGGR